MIIYIDAETLRSPESHRLEILKDTEDNFKAPSTLTKTQAAKDLGLTDAKEIKFTSAGDMILRWEKELAEEKSAEVAQAKWEKTSFDPEVAPIACICIQYIIDDVVYHEAFCTKKLTEKEMLTMFHATIDDICSKNGVQITKPMFTGHYISKFDLPFIWKRSVINNVKTCDGVKWIDGRHGQHYFDTMTAWSGYGKSISMDRLAEVLNLQRKTDGMDGSKVYDTWQEDPQKVIDYCHDDVEMVKQIHERLTQ